MRKLAFTLSTLVAVIVGLDTIGGRPIAPGPETHFEVRPDGDDPTVWRLSANRGNLACCVELALAGSGASLEPASAALSDGTRLGVDCKPGADGLHALRLLPLAADGAPERMFTWPATETIELRLPARGLPVRLVDWSVYLPDEEADTRAKLRWRRAWFWISLATLAVSIPTALYTGWPRAETRRGDAARRCVIEIIDGIEGRDERHTRRLRTVLRKVCVEDASSKEAFEAAGVHGARARVELWVDAREKFVHRLDALLLALHERRDRLVS